MNVDRLLTLADDLDIHPQGFDMNNFGTCIAGRTTALFKKPFDFLEWLGIKDKSEPLFELNARTILGLSQEQAADLFYPTGRGAKEFYRANARTPYQAAPSEAAQVIRYLAGTGIVDWSKGILREAQS